jgi:hypothetical protein
LFEELLRDVSDVAAQKFKEATGPSEKSVSRLPSSAALKLAAAVETSIAPAA